MSTGIEKISEATLGGGCFWCLEAALAEIEGVLEVCPGYCGGELPDPGYERVCQGNTGHVEVVRVRFDPRRLDYRELLRIFFSLHDPTSLDRQGHDEGSQYRSVIFHHDEAQRIAATGLIDELQAAMAPASAPIVTQLRPAVRFYPAEEYHRRYYERNPSVPYCHLVVGPKLREFRQAFAHRLRKESR
jgi:peptide-methionine (S)-S-oxide reductase